MVASAVGDEKVAKELVESELKKTKEEIIFLKKQLLEKTNAGAKAKAAGVKLQEELTQLKADVHKLIGFWEPPPPSENNKNSLLANVDNTSSESPDNNQAQQ
jgi:hypothetical protein